MVVLVNKLVIWLALVFSIHFFTKKLALEMNVVVCFAVSSRGGNWETFKLCFSSHSGKTAENKVTPGKAFETGLY